jgi:hypothetical protein
MIIFSENKIFFDLNEIVNEIVNFWKLGGARAPSAAPPPFPTPLKTKAVFPWDVYVKPKCCCLAIISVFLRIMAPTDSYFVFEKSSCAKICAVFSKKPKR